MGDILWDEPKPSGGLITWDEPDPKASATVRSSLGSNPDKMAQVKQLATEAGMPFDTTERNIDEVAAQQKLKQIQGLMLRNPVLSRQLSDPTFAKVSHDDVPVLDKVSKMVAEPFKGLFGNLNEASTAINLTLGGIPVLYDKFHTLASSTDHTEASDYWFKKFVDPSLERQSNFNHDESTGFAGQALHAVGGLAGMMAQIGLTGGMGGEVDAIAQPTLTQMAKVQTEHAFKTMAAPALSAGVEEARNVMANGGTPQDAARAGVTSYLTNVAMGFGPLSVEGKLGTRVATGAIYGDAIANVNHDLMNLALPSDQQQPELTDEDHALNALIGGLMGGVIGPRGHAENIQKATASVEFNNHLQQIAETASLSKLRARDPESFKQFVEKASEDGELQKVYIDANTLHEAFNQSGINPEQVKLTMPEVANQLDLARQTGADVEIPIADFATHIAGTDLQSAILGHLKVEPDGMTYDESQKFFNEQHTIMHDEANNIINQKAVEDEFVQSAKTVEENLLKQIKATQRYSDEVAKANALLLRDFYVTNSHRLGIMPDQLFAQHPVRIGAEDLNGSKFDQSSTEFKPDEALISEAVKHFGVTRDIRESGYLLPDGRMLDMSGRHQASKADWPYMKGERVVDHRDLSGENMQGHSMKDMLQAKEPSDRMYEFMAKTGAMRIDTESGVASTSRKPTKQQMAALSKAVKGDYLAVDYIRPDGNIVHDAEFENTKLSDLEKFFDDAAKMQGDTGVLAQGSRGAFNPETNTIALLKAADLSTFHHEAGHFFLESLDRLSDSSPEIADDFNKTLDWFGIKPTPELSAMDVWRNMSLEEKREYHEQFARGFEAYLFEGKSPSLEMASTFQRFKAWMMRVYKSIKELGVELNPEIRGVYDRLLATDEQIKLAEQSRSMLPMFSDAEKASMTPEEFAAYHALAKEASDNAASELQSRSLRDMKWIGNTWDKAFKSVSKEVEAKRRAERIEARKQVMQEPLYRAWQFLTGKIDPIVYEKAQSKGLDLTKDSLLTAVAKLGGIDRESSKNDLGVHPDNFKHNAGVFGKPTFRKEGGHTADEMASMLSEYGYLSTNEHGQHSLHDLEDKINEEISGNHQYSFSKEYEQGRENPLSKDDSSSRLNRDYVKTKYGDDVLTRLTKLGMLRADGLHPDDIADYFGINSGEELINDLMTKPEPKEAIEQRTDQLLLEKYGDITSEKSMKEAADAAVHNEVRAKVLATELKALTKSTGKVSDIVRAAKEAAMNVIGAKKVKDLDARIFTNAETRAGKEAMAALSKGETERAATEKRNQILNNQFAKSAIEAKAEIEKIIKNAKKYDKASVAKAIGADYMDRINELLSGYDLTKRDITSTKLEQREELRDWLNTEFERTGIMPDIDEKLLDFANRKSYMEMTVDELRALNDAVKSLEHVGREQQHILIDGQKVELKELIHQALEGTKELPHHEPVDIQPDLLHARGLDKLNAQWLNLKSKVRSMDAALVKMEQLFQWLSAGKRAGLGDNVQGPYLKIFQRAADAEGKERQLRAEAVTKIKDLHKALGDAKIDLNESLTLPLFRNGRGNKWYREELIAMALNMGNKGNREKLLAGYKWDANTVDAILDKNLSKAEWDFVQGVWDSIGVYGKDIMELQRRQTGVTPKMVDPVPFKNSHGSFDGGYYPVVYDSFQDHNIELKNERNADTLFENQWARPATSKGHTINRTNYVGPLHLSLGVIGKHIDQVTHDLAWREAIIDMNKFLSHPDIKKDVDQVMGREYTKQFRPWLQAMANDKVFNSSGDAGWESFYRKARTNATIVGLGFRLSTMEIHGLSAMSNSIGEVGASWFAKGAAQFSTPERWKDSVKFIFDRSPEMANRMNESDRNIHEAIDEINRHEASLTASSMAQKTVDGARKLSMYGVSALDMGSAMPTWMGAYLKGIESTNKGGLGMSENQAIDFANRAVRNAHGGGGTKDLSAIQRSKGAMSLFTMFYSFWNHMYNRQRDLAKGYANIGDSFKQGTGSRDISKLIARSFFYFVVPQIVHAALKPSPQDNQNSGDLASHLKHLAEEVGLGFVSGVPGLRDLANAAINGRDYTITPLEQAGKTLVQATVDTYKIATGDEPSKHATKHIVNAVGYVAGLPTGQASSSVDFLTDVMSGEQDPKSLSDWWAGVHTGDMTKQ